jgi:hypothetical protein
MTDKEKTKQTICYSYEVTMIIQVFAEDEEAAKIKLDADGGHVSSRVVALKDAINLYSGENN